MLTSKISARHFAPIGPLGETVGFSDFTTTELAMNGYAQVAKRSTEFLSDTLFSGITTDSIGKVALVNAVQAEVDLYLATITDTLVSTIDARIFITNVVFSDRPDPAVIDVKSKYVERDPTTTVYWTVKFQRT